MEVFYYFWKRNNLHLFRIGQSSYSSLLKLSDEAIDQLVTDIQGTIEIDADGPYGRFGGVDDITLFEEISAEVPTCYFSGVIEGYCGEGRQVVKGELSECVLHLWYKYADDDGDDYDCDEEMIQWDEETIYNPIKKKYQ